MSRISNSSGFRDQRFTMFNEEKLHIIIVVIPSIGMIMISEGILAAYMDRYS